MGLKAKNILVTGGNGFIGSHLVRYLVSKKTNVTVPYIDIDKNSYFHRHQLHKKTRFVYCNLRNFADIFRLIKRNKIDFIFHLAAQSDVIEAIDNPLETFDSNIMGTVNVLEAAKRWGKVRGMIVTSSDKAYGKIRRATEKNAIGGDHPYETSKASADLAAHTYFKTFGLPVIVTRFGNVYGEGDLNFNRIIPGIMEAIIKKRELAIRSNGKFVRDYVYVEDVVDACILLSRNVRRLSGEAFNISSLENLSVLELVGRIGEILNVPTKYKVYNRAVNEISAQSIDFAKIRKTLGWKPKSSLKTIIPLVYDWYKSYFANFKKKS